MLICIITQAHRKHPYHRVFSFYVSNGSPLIFIIFFKHYLINILFGKSVIIEWKIVFFIIIHITYLEYFEFFKFLVYGSCLCLFHSNIEYLSHRNISVHEHRIDALKYALIFCRQVSLGGISLCSIVFDIFIVIRSFFINLKIYIGNLLISYQRWNTCSLLFSSKYQDTSSKLMSVYHKWGEAYIRIMSFGKMIIEK